MPGHRLRDYSRPTSSSSVLPLLSSSEKHTTPSSSYSSILLVPLAYRRRATKLLAVLVLVLLALSILGQYTKPQSWSNLSRLLSSRRRSAQEEERKEQPQPSTELGWEADYVYENMGSTDKTAYREELETFITQAFPASDSNKSNPDSILSIFHEFFPPPKPNIVDPQTAFQQLLLAPFKHIQRFASRLLFPEPPPPPPKPRRTIPQKIHQTSAYPGDRGDPQYAPYWQTWIRNHPDYQYNYYDNEAAQRFVENRFSGTGEGGLLGTYNSMKDIPVMQSDFWRYAIVASEGGVYSDMDTISLKSVHGWHRPPWQRNIDSLPEDPYPLPSIIVGIEQDVGTRQDWHNFWPRPIGFVQWTIAGTPGHPILIDTLRRVSEAVNPSNKTLLEMRKGAVTPDGHRKLDAVVEMTGPGAFTDSVLRYLQTKYNVSWPYFRQLPNEGILFADNQTGADVLVLSVTAFSPGVGLFNAGSVDHVAALVQHLFKGSWKAQWG